MWMLVLLGGGGGGEVVSYCLVVSLGGGGEVVSLNTPATLISGTRSAHTGARAATLW